MQIIRGGKLSQLQRLVEICVKNFAVVSFVQYLIVSALMCPWQSTSQHLCGTPNHSSRVSHTDCTSLS